MDVEMSLGAPRPHIVRAISVHSNGTSVVISCFAGVRLCSL